MKRTYLLDLDGTLVRHQVPPWQEEWQLLPGVVETLRDLWDEGHLIIIVTGRPSCIRAHTERMLTEAGIYYHQLVMDAGSGQRVLVNDLKPYAPDTPTAVAVNLPRNQGFQDHGVALDPGTRDIDRQPNGGH